MGHVRTLQANSDLAEIWYYVATKAAALTLQTGSLIPSRTVSSCSQIIRI
jgi:hypothetical protein